jgi:hypothetical protein
LPAEARSAKAGHARRIQAARTALEIIVYVLEYHSHNTVVRALLLKLFLRFHNVSLFIIEANPLF